VTRYDGWTNLVPDERSIDRVEQVAVHILDTIVVHQICVGYWAQSPNLSEQRSSYALGL
jgi:hypothetical protein